MKNAMPLASLTLCFGCLAGSPGEATEVTPVDSPPSTPVVSATTATPPTATSAPRSPFSVIARGGAAFRLHRLVDGALLVSTGPLVMRVDASGEVLYDPTMLRGITPIRDAAVAGDGSFDGVIQWAPIALGGRWPDALFLSLDFSSGFRGEGGQPITYRHTPNGWTKLQTRGASFEHHVVALHPWIDGSILAHRGYVPWFPGQERWREDDGPTARQAQAAEKAILAAKKLVVVRGEPKAPDIGASLDAFASLATGEIVAVTGGPSPTAILIASTGTRTTLALPGDPMDIEGVVIDAPDRAWVFGTQRSEGGDYHPYLARIEAGRISAGEAPPCKSAGLRSFVALPGGALWTTCADPAYLESACNDHELWTRPAGGAWTAVPLPEGVDVPTEVEARADDDVWVAASMKDQRVLLHTRPRARVLELPGLEGIGRALHEYNDLLPLTQHCVTGYVALSAAPGDASKIREQLATDLGLFSRRATIHLVRTTIRGAEQLGLRVAVDSDDVAADTKALHALVRKRLGDDAVSAPRCWEPTVEEGGTVGEWERPRAGG
jgi:hypothetical protein